MEDQKRVCRDSHRQQQTSTRTEGGQRSDVNAYYDMDQAMMPVKLKWLEPGKSKSRTWRVQDKRAQRAKMPAKAQERSPTDISATSIFYSRLETRFEALQLVEAAEYFNTRVAPSLQPMHEITPNLAIRLISPCVFQRCLSVPDHTRLSLVCSSLAHQMNQSDELSQPLRRKFFNYRGRMIRSLYIDLNEDPLRKKNILIMGMYNLLVVDIQQGLCHQSWRHHLDGIKRILNLRGGVPNLSASMSELPFLQTYMLFVVLGDTSSPASDQFMDREQLADFDFMMNHHAKDHDFFTMFPEPLFAATIHINYLRNRASKKRLRELENLTSKAFDILGTVLSFSPENWASCRSKVQAQDFTLLAAVYQTAVALYCIASLQSSSVLPLTPFLKNSSITLSQTLQNFLSEALPFPRFRRLLTWPLVVLGMHAVDGGSEMRIFVQQKLQEISRFAGSYMPRTARAVLEKFWASGATRWDSCFDRPYMFYSIQGMDSRVLKSLV